MNGDVVLRGVRQCLVVAPHTDDEFGCAGTIVRMRRLGIAVRYLALSKCTASVPAGYPENVLEVECRAATKSLGIAPDAVEILDFPVRHFSEKRQDILEKLVAVNRAHGPDLVLLPSTSDIHQDHATTAMEGLRAFKHSTVLGYELPQNTTAFPNTAFVALSQDDLDRKIAAMTEYRSQHHRPYAAPEFITGLARVRGVQANTALAEAYEVMRLILR